MSTIDFSDVRKEYSILRWVSTYAKMTIISLLLGGYAMSAEALPGGPYDYANDAKFPHAHYQSGSGGAPFVINSNEQCPAPTSYPQLPYEHLLTYDERTVLPDTTPNVADTCILSPYAVCARYIPVCENCDQVYAKGFKGYVETDYVDPLNYLARIEWIYNLYHKIPPTDSLMPTREVWQMRYENSAEKNYMGHGYGLTWPSYNNGVPVMTTDRAIAFPRCPTPIELASDTKFWAMVVPQVHQSQAITLYRAGNNITTFVRANKDSAWIGASSEQGSLAGDWPSGFLYTTVDGETEYYGNYNGHYYLSYIRSRTNMIVTIERDANDPQQILGISSAVGITNNSPYGKSLLIDFSKFDFYTHTGEISTAAGDKYTYWSDTNKTIVGYPEIAGYTGGTSKVYLYGETDKAGGVIDGVKVRNEDVLTGIFYVPIAGAAVNSALPSSATASSILSFIAQNNGGRLQSNYYNAAGQTTQISYGNDLYKKSFQYTTGDTFTISETDPLGTVRTLTFQKVSQDPIIYRHTATDKYCDGCFKSASYDGAGRMTSYTDFAGYKTCYQYDQIRNLELYRLEGLAVGASCPENLASYTPSTALGSVERKIATEWHSTLRLPVTITEAKLKTSYSYNTDGQLLTFKADTTTGGSLRTTTYSYYLTGENGAGKIKQIDGPRTDVADISKYEYDSVGRLSKIINAAGHITTIESYDTRGNPQQIRTPDNVVSILRYNARNGLESIKRGVNNEEIAQSYNPLGNLAKVTFTTGGEYSYTYDSAQRLTRITDRDGNYIQYTLDPMGNRTKEEVKNSAGTVLQVHSRQFNSLNQLWKDIGAVNTETTIYEYSSNGNLTKITDPLAHVTVNNYDALSRLISVTDPALTTTTPAGITKYGYNALDQLTQVTDPRNLVTTYLRDDLGNLTGVISPDTGKTSYTEYDLAGNLKKRTDEKKQTTSYKYDALNRLTQAEYRDSANLVALIIAYSYDAGTYGKGHLTGITETAYTGGTSTTLGTPSVVGISSYSYNQFGRLSAETRNQNSVTYTTSYGYDTLGRLNSITYPSNRVVSYTFDSQGRINKISTSYGSETAVLASSISYFPFGGVKSFNYGDGLTQPVQSYSRSINANGLLSAYTLGKQNNSGVIKGNQYAVQYDNARQLQKLVNTNLATNGIIATDTFGYDKLGQLINYSQNGVTGQTLVYDTVGNRTSQTVGTASSSYSYPTTSNRLSAITKTGVTTALTYRAVAK